MRIMRSAVSVVASTPYGTTMYSGLEEKILTRYKNQFSDTPYCKLHDTLQPRLMLLAAKLLSLFRTII